jgi:hypothetical protein
MFRAAARVQIVFGDNRAPRMNYCEMSGRSIAGFRIAARRRATIAVLRCDITAWAVNGLLKPLEPQEIAEDGRGLRSLGFWIFYR